MSWPRTLADFLAESPELIDFVAVQPDSDPLQPTAQVLAPCCGRRTPADTIVSLAGLTTEIRGGNFRPKADLQWACDGCLALLIADKSNGWTWSNLFTALGAPDSVVRHQLALEVLKDAELNASQKGEAIQEDAVYGVALEALPADLSTDRATQRPDQNVSETQVPATSSLPDAT